MGGRGVVEFSTSRIHHHTLHRFGNGSDGAGDPNVMDMFVDNADGSDDEADIQFDQLNDWESGMDPEDTSADKLTVIKLVK